jgi:hypothetical protein
MHCQSALPVFSVGSEFRGGDLEVRRRSPEHHSCIVRFDAKNSDEVRLGEA